jgi:hypothetical protein
MNKRIKEIVEQHHLKTHSKKKTHATPSLELPVLKEAGAA